MLQNHVHTKNKGRVEHIHVTKGHWHPFKLILSHLHAGHPIFHRFHIWHSRHQELPWFICQQLFDEAERALKHLSTLCRFFTILWYCTRFWRAPGSWISLWQHLQVHRYSMLQLLSFQGWRSIMKQPIESAELLDWRLEDTTPALPCASQRDSSDVVFERFQVQRLQRFVASIID